MKKIIVDGGVPLRGSVRVSGSKNAALPILFATICIRGTSTVRNVPDIGDVRVAIRILRELGARVSRKNDEIRVDATELEYKKPDIALTSRIRASTYLIGACLARFGVCHLLPFGGCNFAERPIDLHLFAASRLGADVNDDSVSAKRLSSALIDLPKKSVGATANALIMSASCQGESVIRGFASEPHVLNLIDFLRSAGAKISVSDSEIRVVGGTFNSASVSVIGDMIEAGTYASAAIASGGDISVLGVNPTELSSFSSALACGGVGVEIEEDGVRYYGRLKREIELRAAPYPDFPTDLQPIFAPLLALSRGGRISDSVFPTRFGYLEELKKFGISSSVNFFCAHIYRAGEIRPTAVNAPDLRGGAACLIAALCAKGKSQITDADKILRGYEDIDKKLAELGARITISD